MQWLNGLLYITNQVDNYFFYHLKASGKKKNAMDKSTWNAHCKGRLYILLAAHDTTLRAYIIDFQPLENDQVGKMAKAIALNKSTDDARLKRNTCVTPLEDKPLWENWNVILSINKCSKSMRTRVNCWSKLGTERQVKTPLNKLACKHCCWILLRLRYIVDI